MMMMILLFSFVFFFSPLALGFFGFILFLKLR